ncbi:MFS transporter [Holophaga foetida]|uniref:MFS transporter n=1 Tax=Holophaga foetida TaxID=35839 RepID=UPI0002473AB3|nr:MFS transporter [Holophaga foetida]
MALLRPRTSALVVVSAALFTDTLLYYLLVPLLPIYSRDFGFSQMQLGLLFGSYSAALLLGTLPLGRLGDRFGRRYTMLWGLVGLGGTTLLFAFSRSFWLLLVARVLQGLSATATWTSGMALMADHWPSEHRGKAMSTCFAFANLGVFLGPPIAGFLAEHFGLRAPFLLAGGLAILDALARAFLLEDAPKEKGETLEYRALLKNGTVRLFAGATALGAGIWATLESTLPLHFDRVMGWRPSSIGLCFAVAALGHTLTSPLAGALADRYGHRGILRIGLVLILFLAPLPVFFQASWIILGSMAGLGLATSLVMSPASPAVTDAVERMGSTSYATVFGLLNLSYAMGMMVGPILGSAGVEALGIRSTMLLLGLFFGAYALGVGREVAR